MREQYSVTTVWRAAKFPPQPRAQNLLQTCDARLQEDDRYHGRLDWRQRRSAHRLDAHLQTFCLAQHGARRPAPAAASRRRAHEVINALLQARHLRNPVTYISVQYALLLQAHMLLSN